MAGPISERIVCAVRTPIPGTAVTSTPKTR
jgi:hypothetical protein